MTSFLAASCRTSLIHLISPSFHVCAKRLQCALLGQNKYTSMGNVHIPRESTNLWRHVVVFALRRRKYLRVRAQEQILISPNQDKTKYLTKNIYANSLQLTPKSAVTKTDRPAELTEGTLLLRDWEVTL